MKILIDFFPILLFFGAYKFYGIYVGTAVLMASTVVQMGIIYAIDRRLQTMHKATLVLILLFGTLTLVLQDDRFIKWKPTVLYGAMALALAVAVWVMKMSSAVPSPCVVGCTMLRMETSYWLKISLMAARTPDSSFTSRRR